MYNRCYVVFLQKLALQYYCTPIYVHFYKSDIGAFLLLGRGRRDGFLAKLF